MRQKILIDLPIEITKDEVVIQLDKKVKEQEAKIARLEKKVSKLEIFNKEEEKKIQGIKEIEVKLLELLESIQEIFPQDDYN